MKNLSEGNKLKRISLLAALSTPTIIVASFISLAIGFYACFQVMGWEFFYITNWDPVGGKYGVLVFLTGTFLTTLLSLILSVPLSLSIAIFVSEIAPHNLYSRFIFRTTSVIASIPSVVIGLWGIYTVIPLMQKLQTFFGQTPYGLGFFSASIVLAFMITPYAAMLIYEVLRLVPNTLKEASYALGATRYETIRYVTIPYVKGGIFAGILLSAGRAIGETMAVTMLIGNANYLIKNIFSPTNTMASIIANEFAEAVDPVYYSALLGVGLTLMTFTFVLSFVGRIILKKITVK